MRFLLSDVTDERLALGGFVSLDNGRLNVLPFEDLLDPKTGRTRVRVVDTESEHYRVAREYMIRLERENLEDAEMCRRLAGAAHMSPEDFLAEFSQLWPEETVRYLRNKPAAKAS